eukprot:5654364-Pleurochrysis_carterae.AAC.2
MWLQCLRYLSLHASSPAGTDPNAKFPGPRAAGGVQRRRQRRRRLAATWTAALQEGTAKGRCRSKALFRISLLACCPAGFTVSAKRPAYKLHRDLWTVE